MCCGVIFIIIIIIVVLYFYTKKESDPAIRRCPICKGPVMKSKTECQWCGHKIESVYKKESADYSQEPYYGAEKKSTHTYMDNIGKTMRRSGDKITRFFGKKNICNDCQSALIYREEYQSWYCPECHTYK